MITNARSSRLVVISDLHLGNPFSRGRHDAIKFLKWPQLMTTIYVLMVMD